MKRIMFLLMIFLVILGSFGISANIEASDIPKQIRDLVFVNSKFSKPISKIIPLEDEPGKAEKIRREEQKADQERGLVPRIIIWDLNLKHFHDKDFLNFLLAHDYVRIEAFTLYIKREKQDPEVRLFYYNDKLKPYILRQSERGSVTDTLLDHFRDMPINSSEILLASRKLKSIDYTNQYEGTILATGAKTKFYALTFSYVLEEKLPKLPKINKVFHGKAKAYLDPDDGQWKFWPEGLKLEDSGSSEYIKLLEQQYKDVKVEQVSSIKPVEEPTIPVKKERGPITLEAALQTERERIKKISTFKRLRMSLLITEGKNAMEKRDWNDAVQAYKKLLEIDPDSYETHINIGNAYAMLNEFDLSIRHLSRAIQIIPVDPTPYTIMVYTYARKGDYGLAIEYLKNAAERGCNHIELLKKDSDLPEDFRQDPRFKKLLGIGQSTQLQLNRLWSSNNTNENVIALTYKNVRQESDKVKADVALTNSTGTWVFVQQNLNPSLKARMPVPGTYTHLLGPFTNKELGTIEFPKGSFLQLDARSPVGLKGSMLDPANLSLLAAVAVDLTMRGLFNKELPPNAFDNSVVISTEVGLESIDPLFKTISSHCSGQLGALGNAIGAKNTEDALKAIAGFALCTKGIKEKMEEWLTKYCTRDIAKKYVNWASKNTVDILDAPTRVTLIGLLTKYTFSAPPESWVRIEAIEK